MTKVAEAGHVVNCMRTGALQCLKCGTTYDISKLFPCSVPCYVAFSKAWINEHRFCKETDRGRALQCQGRTISDLYAARYPKAARGEEKTQG